MASNRHVHGHACAGIHDAGVPIASAAMHDAACRNVLPELRLVACGGAVVNLRAAFRALMRRKPLSVQHL